MWGYEPTLGALSRASVTGLKVEVNESRLPSERVPDCSENRMGPRGPFARATELFALGSEPVANACRGLERAEPRGAIGYPPDRHRIARVDLDNDNPGEDE
jgi:hypothetical protein